LQFSFLYYICSMVNMIEKRGAEAYNLFCKGFHDGDNPFRQHTGEFQDWEQGWTNAMRIDQQRHEQAMYEEREVQNG